MVKHTGKVQSVSRGTKTAMVQSDRGALVEVSTDPFEALIGDMIVYDVPSQGMSKMTGKMGAEPATQGKRKY